MRLERQGGTVYWNIVDLKRGVIKRAGCKGMENIRTSRYANVRKKMVKGI